MRKLGNNLVEIYKQNQQTNVINQWKLIILLGVFTEKEDEDKAKKERPSFVLFEPETGIIPQFLSEFNEYGKPKRDNALLLQGLAGCGKSTVC